MKVYVLVTDAAYDYDAEITLEVFASYDDALKRFKECVEQDMKEDHLFDRSDFVVDSDEDSFSVYIDGEYSRDHYNIYIDTQEVK